MARKSLVRLEIETERNRYTENEPEDEDILFKDPSYCFRKNAREPLISLSSGLNRGSNSYCDSNSFCDNSQLAA